MSRCTWGRCTLEQALTRSSRSGRSWCWGSFGAVVRGREPADDDAPDETTSEEE